MNLTKKLGIPLTLYLIIVVTAAMGWLYFNTIDQVSNFSHESTDQISKLDARLADSSLYERQPDTAAMLAIERGQLAKALAQAEDAWLAASQAYEEAEAESID